MFYLSPLLSLPTSLSILEIVIITAVGTPPARTVRDPLYMIPHIPLCYLNLTIISSKSGSRFHPMSHSRISLEPLTQYTEPELYCQAE